MKSFIETFKEQLKSHNFKKEKLTGISQADISRLENGEANPTIEMLNRIAYAFGKKLELQFT